MSIKQLDRLISKSPYFILLGLTYGIIIAQFGGMFIISATMLIGLGASLASVHNYKAEMGIWMLAVVFGSFSLFGCLIFEAFAVTDFVQAQNIVWLVFLDISIATSLLWLQCRALWSVILINRALVE